MGNTALKNGSTAVASRWRHCVLIRGGSRGGRGVMREMHPPQPFSTMLWIKKFSCNFEPVHNHGANPWRDVSPSIIRQLPPQYFHVPKLGISEHDFLVFTSFWAKSWASGNVITIFLVFTSFWAKNWTSEDVSILLNHPPQYQNMVDFAESSPLMLNIDLHLCS